MQPAAVAETSSSRSAPQSQPRPATCPTADARGLPRTTLQNWPASFSYGAALVATRVHRACFDETQGISPGILGIERSLTPGAHDDPASGCLVNVLARQTVQRLRTFECWF